VVVVVGGPGSPDVRAKPFAYAAGAPVWVEIRGEWWAGLVLAASAQAVLVRHAWAGRGTGVETVAWRQLAGGERTECVPRIDGRQRAAGALVG
jgi:hypothetical protein